MSAATSPPAWADVQFPRPFRRHQQLALDAITAALADGSTRSWVVLPPGAGKTLVGLEAARRLERPIVVFSPNTAIQAQWCSAWAEFTPASIAAGTSRELSAPVTALTYQSLATFDPDAEVDEEGREHRSSSTKRRRGSLIDRLHVNGAALVDALKDAGPITLVLDECHHLLEVWGRLLAELLEELPHAHVIGLTGTPPDTLSAEQGELVEELFGAPLFSTTIPSVVREGHLAPFAELAWFTEPTPGESQWLAAQAERFAELRTDLLKPRTGFLEWLDRRFVTRPVGSTGDSAEALAVEWSRLAGEHPEQTAAALRFHHAGLLALPPGAIVREEHRHDPTAADWVALVGDYVTTRLLPSSDPADQALVDEIRAALPSIGYQLTKRGIRRGRSPVDRVLARSEAKTDAAVEILAAEAGNLGPQLRSLVLCDHERASATLPARLRGVLDAQAGSALLVLANLVADERTAALNPVLITGRTVAAGVGTARSLIEFVRQHAPDVELDPIADDADGLVEITGRWSSRRWVRLVTRFYETGASRVLVGTRGLLGEGWDARGVNTLVDLTNATTPTAVVQTRGRALRVDPQWPEKVANTWSVVCVSADHPGGTSDWDRFVRKHQGYFAVTDSGEIVSGVSHVDPRLSPYAPPPVAEFAAENALMLDRAANRARVRELWQVGTPYRDELVHTIRVQPATVDPGDVRGPVTTPMPVPELVPAARGAKAAGPGYAVPSRRPAAAVAGLAALLVLVAVGTELWWLAAAALAAVTGVWADWVRRRRGVELRAGRALTGLADGPGPFAFGYAVADGLYAAGLSDVGADGVAGVVEHDGSYRLALTGVDAQTSRLFAESLDEVLATITAPRYVVPRYVVDAPPGSDGAVRAAGRAWLKGTAADNTVVYHAVPSALGANISRVTCFVEAWNRWISDGEAVRIATPEGEGILVTHRGADPFAATTGLRVAWG